MINLIVGKKGSGKTKVLLDKVEKAVEKSNGNVIFIDNSDQHTFKVDHRVRFINALNYSVDGFDRFLGFVAGILAGNYDITDIYVDAILQIVGRDYDKLGKLLEELERIAQEVHICLTISAAQEELPESVLRYVVE